MEKISQKIFRLRLSGLSYEQIAVAVPCAISTVWYYLTPGAKSDMKKRVASQRRGLAPLLKKYHGGKCFSCGYSKCLSALDFHHLGFEAKKSTVSQLINKGKYSEAREEATKCVLLCSNCHREHHAGYIKVVGPQGFSP